MSLKQDTLHDSEQIILKSLLSYPYPSPQQPLWNRSWLLLLPVLKLSSPSPPASASLPLPFRLLLSSSQNRMHFASLRPPSIHLLCSAATQSQTSRPPLKRGGVCKHLSSYTLSLAPSQIFPGESFMNVPLKTGHQPSRPPSTHPIVLPQHFSPIRLSQIPLWHQGGGMLRLLVRTGLQ